MSKEDRGSTAAPLTPPEGTGVHSRARSSPQERHLCHLTFVNRRSPTQVLLLSRQWERHKAQEFQFFSVMDDFRRRCIDLHCTDVIADWHAQTHIDVKVQEFIHSSSPYDNCEQVA